MPAAVFLIDPARHVIVIDGDDRFNTRSLEFIDQIVVELNALGIDLAVCRRNNP